MVAYSFKPRFVPAIVAATKCQTIRGERARHVKPGERLQLFTGMRTKQCEKIIDDPLCLSVQAILMTWNQDRFTRVCIVPGQVFEWYGFPHDFDFARHHYDDFAVRDGFTDELDMVNFWRTEHGSNHFQGVLIRWQTGTP